MFDKRLYWEYEAETVREKARKDFKDYIEEKKRKKLFYIRIIGYGFELISSLYLLLLIRNLLID